MLSSPIDVKSYDTFLNKRKVEANLNYFSQTNPVIAVTVSLSLVWGFPRHRRFSVHCNVFGDVSLVHLVELVVCMGGLAFGLDLKM